MDKYKLKSFLESDSQCKDIEEAIELLKNYGGCVVVNERGIIRLNGDMLIRLLKQQAKYAELGRISISEVRGAVCSIPTFRERNEQGRCKGHCTNYNFCKLRAELERESK